MRILFTAVPFVGHLNPLIAQARELHRRGHRAVMASVTEAGAHVAAEAPELPFMDLGPVGDRDATLRRTIQAASIDPQFARGAFRLARGLLDTWEPMFDGLRVALAADPPDLVVADLFTAGAICATQAAGIRLVVNNACLLQMIPAAVLPPLGAVPMPFTGQSMHDVGLYNRLLARAVPHLGRVLAVRNGSRRLNALRRSRGLPPADTEGRLRGTLILVNDAFGFEYQRPLPPAIEMVGPMLAADPPPLPEELAAWLADGPPVVYANLGTVAVPPPDQLAAMSEAFRADDFRVLWVLRSAAARNVTPPANVRILNWGPPPRAVLASPHVRAFVSHCGPNSVHESLFAGTPIVGIPFFADQLDVAVRVADAGVGVWLWKHTFTGDSLRDAIRRVLSDGAFTDRIAPVQRRSPAPAASPNGDLITAAAASD